MSKPIVKPKAKKARALLDQDLQEQYDLLQSTMERLELILLQMLRELKRLK